VGLRGSFMPEALGRPEDKGLPYSGIQGHLFPHFQKIEKRLPGTLK